MFAGGYDERSSGQVQRQVPEGYEPRRCARGDLEDLPQSSGKEAYEAEDRELTYVLGSDDNCEANQSTSNEG